jgi:hypothetical protein
LYHDARIHERQVSRNLNFRIVSTIKHTVGSEKIRN